MKYLTLKIAFGLGLITILLLEIGLFFTPNPPAWLGWIPVIAGATVAILVGYRAVR